MASKVDICNMALSFLGSNGSVNDIDQPENDSERAFSRWYDTTKRTVLSLTKPNFALKRARIPRIEEEIIFGFSNSYQIPSDCLKVLGIGNIEDKANNFTVEGGKIYTEENWEDGLPLRYVANIDDVNSFSTEFRELLALHLARNVCKDITESTDMLQYLDALIPAKNALVTSLKSQENKPIRITRSKYRASKTVENPRWNEKK